jgi:uncharacterized protein DUF1801
MKSIDSFYAGLREPTKSCLLALRIIILKHNPAITEAIKYGMPCFSYQNKMLCYFWSDKKTGMPYIGFKDYKKLALPWLEADNRSAMSIMFIDPYADLPLKRIRQTLTACIRLHESRLSPVKRKL